MIDVSSLIGDIPPTTITVRTYPAATQDTFYRTVDGTPVDVQETAVVHPNVKKRNHRERQVDSGREEISVYVVADSALIGTETSKPPRVLYQGRWYERTETFDYRELGGILWITAALVDEVAPEPP